MRWIFRLQQNESEFQRFSADLLNATINADNFNVTAGKDFYYDGVDFKLDANDSLVVLGSAFFNVDDFYNYGEIDVANDLQCYRRKFCLFQ